MDTMDQDDSRDREFTFSDDDASQLIDDIEKHIEVDGLTHAEIKKDIEDLRKRGQYKRGRDDAPIVDSSLCISLTNKIKSSIETLTKARQELNKIPLGQRLAADKIRKELQSTTTAPIAFFYRDRYDHRIQPAWRLSDKDDDEEAATSIYYNEELINPWCEINGKDPDEVFNMIAVSFLSWHLEMSAETYRTYNKYVRHCQRLADLEELIDGLIEPQHDSGLEAMMDSLNMQNPRDSRLEAMMDSLNMQNPRDSQSYARPNILKMRRKNIRILPH
jgi:hypothetical protein